MSRSIGPTRVTEMIMTTRPLVSFIVGTSLIALAASVGGQGGAIGNGASSALADARGLFGGEVYGGGGATLQKFMDDEFKKIKATAAQIKDIDAYMDHARKVRDAYRKAHPNMDSQAKHQMMEKARSELIAFVKKTLNAAQFKQWDDDLKARAAKDIPNPAIAKNSGAI